MRRPAVVAVNLRSVAPSPDMPPPALLNTPRPIRARIFNSAFAQNLALARRCAPNAKVLAVVKANAYGHGLLRAASALRGADGFAMLDLPDAVRLREAGFAHRIVLLEGFFLPAELADFARYRITAVVHREGQLEALEQAKLSAPIDIMLKLNTGMNRLGFSVSQWPLAVARAKACAAVNSITLMTHFACADDDRGIAEQLALFERECAPFTHARSMANSATLLRFAQAQGEWVRPGIMLYGSSPFADQSAQSLGLRCVMQLESQVIAVQHLEPGDRVGYGGTFRADQPMRIGIVACGYADGYPRHAPSGAPVLVGGQRTRTVGRVSMDMLATDITYLMKADVGSPVELWGENLSVDEVAASAGTVSYELLCALAPRVPIVEVD